MSADLSRLALAQGLYKSCEKLVDSQGGAHGAANLRTEADDQLRALYEEAGIDRVRLSVNGENVGTLSARLSNPTDEVRVEVEDVEAFARWLAVDYLGNRLDRTAALQRALADPRTRCALVDAATAEGELPEGCRAVKEERPAMWLGTTLRVDAAKVAKAYGSPAALNAAVAGLLGTGDEDADQEL